MARGIPKRAVKILEELVQEFGFAAVVAELSALAMGQAEELEHVDEPWADAEDIGAYVWAAKLLGKCADDLNKLSGS